MRIMYVWPSHQHQRVQAFDKLVTGAVELVYDPRVVARLGAAALPLQGVVDGLFLPNMIAGQARAPRKMAGDLSRTALLPLSYDEAARANNVIDPLYRQRGPWIPLAAEVYSAPHGGKVSASKLLYGRAATGANAAQVRGMRPGSTARTTVSIHSPRPGEPLRYAMSRPIILARMAILAEGPGVATAVTLHEARHAVDALRWGLSYQTIEAGASSEVHAHGVQGIVLDEFANYNPIWDMRPQLVANAQAQYADPNRPDYAPPELIRTLQDAQII